MNYYVINQHEASQSQTYLLIPHAWPIRKSGFRPGVGYRVFGRWPHAPFARTWFQLLLWLSHSGGRAGLDRGMLTNLIHVVVRQSFELDSSRSAATDKFGMHRGWRTGHAEAVRGGGRDRMKGTRGAPPSGKSSLGDYPSPRGRAKLGSPHSLVLRSLGSLTDRSVADTAGCAALALAHSNGRGGPQSE